MAAAVGGLGAWGGDMVAGFATPLLPKGADGNVSPMVEKAVRYAIIGVAVSTAFHLLRRKKG